MLIRPINLPPLKFTASWIHHRVHLYYLNILNYSNNAFSYPSNCLFASIFRKPNSITYLYKTYYLENLFLFLNLWDLFAFYFNVLLNIFYYWHLASCHHFIKILITKTHRNMKYACPWFGILDLFSIFQNEYFLLFVIDNYDFSFVVL